MRGLGEPQRAGVQRLYYAPDLTILNVLWAPGMTVMPHNHLMAAVIGLYTGREDNIFWRRIETEDGPRIEAAGARSIGVRDCVPLGRDIIHSVTNPVSKVNWRDPCLRRRLLCDRAQRMGAGVVGGAPLRRRKEYALVRGGERQVGGSHGEPLRRRFSLTIRLSIWLCLR